MIDTLREIIQGALARLSTQIKNDLPPLLAALIIILVAYVAALFCRWLITRIFKGIEVDRWLRHSGLPELLHLSRGVRTSRVAAQGAFWGVLLIGLLAAINVFGSQLTSHIVESVVLLLPRLLAAGLIVLAGLWLAQYLGRGALIWAVNEDLPSPRKLSMAVRVLVVFAAVVIASETLKFAPMLFFSAFLLVVGGVVLCTSLAIGLGARDSVRRYFEQQNTARDDSEQHAVDGRSLWDHL